MLTLHCKNRDKYKLTKHYDLSGGDTGSTNRVYGAGRAPPRGEGAAAAEHAVGRGEGAAAAAASHGNAQAQSHRVCAVGCRLEITSRYVESFT